MLLQVCAAPSLSSATIILYYSATYGTIVMFNVNGFMNQSCNQLCLYDIKYVKAHVSVTPRQARATQRLANWCMTTLLCYMIFSKNCVESVV